MPQLDARKISRAEFKSGKGQTPTLKGDEIKNYIKNYIETYRQRVESERLREIFLPNFYKKYPFSVIVYCLPNNAICILFKSAISFKIEITNTGFDHLAGILKERDFDYFVSYYPFEELTEQTAIRNATSDAERDIHSTKLQKGIEITIRGLQELMKRIKAAYRTHLSAEPHSRDELNRLAIITEILENLHEDCILFEENRYIENEWKFDLLKSYEPSTQISQISSKIDIDQLEDFIKEFDNRQNKIESSILELTEKLLELEEHRGEGKRSEANVLAGINLAILQLNEQMVNINKKVENIYTKELRRAPEHIKNTVFRMNRKLYLLEKKLETLERNMSRPKEMKKFIRSFKI